jgi:hypothetical protein
MTEQAETNEAQNPLTKPKFIISAVVVALLVALGIILALLPKGSGEADPAPMASITSAATAQPSAASDVSVCGLPDGSQSKPVTAPADTKWELVGKFAAPTSPKQYGPGRTADGLRTCFAHSPTGALYAGTNMIILGSSGRVDLLAQHLVAEGPERDKMLAQPATNAPQTAPFQLAGFKVVDYSGDRAVIEYGVTTANGSVGSFPIAMQWQAGDWKWVPPATGQPEAKQLADLNGFIRWAGV